ncbi:hypothetical protein BFDFBN_BFDFBN_14080, partial [Dysosmobacter welbionis]
DHPPGEGAAEQLHHRLLRRPEIRPHRPLPGERPEPVRSHQLRADLPHRA